ncbi:hypothetical protein KAR91_68965 [Candidatus Pacearchaeota archaeon]|nr:hypothetical protein [Candidatus Pacearchaeota archaeon]
MSDELKTRTATIEISWMDSANTVSAETLQKHFNRLLRDCNDGRYDFHTEMLQAGLLTTITSANGDAIQDEETKKHGHNVIIKNGDGSSTSKAYLEASKRMRNGEGFAGGLQILNIEVVDK